MRRIAHILLLLILPAGWIAAGTGSNYTIFGVGDLRLSSSVRNNGLGYAGMALADGRSINVNSPGTWSAIKDSRIEVSLLYEGFNSTDGTKSLSVAQTNFSGGSLAVPISTAYGIVIVGSMQPYSKKNYNVYTSGSQEGMDYILNHKGSGGLGKGQIGISFAPFGFLSMGASFDYVFGSLENTRTLQSLTLAYAGGEVNGRTRTNGITGTFGVLVSGLGGNIIGLLSPLTVGAVFTTRGYLNTTGDFLTTTENEADTIQVSSGEILIPASLTIGASYMLGSRIAVLADFFTQQWSRANLGVTTRDLRLYGFGIERTPATEASATFIDRVAFRLGSYLHDTYYVVNGTPITEWGVTGGLGVPFAPDSRLNLAVEYGERGSTDDGLIKEKILRFSLGITISELWFLTFEDE